MHRVSPSYWNLIASSQLLNVHKYSFRDSKAVVTPFMQDGTYPPRNFATLGPSELRPPFTETYKKNKKCLFFFHFTALGRCQILFYFKKFAKSCVFKKQSLLLVINTFRVSFSRSYRKNLPNSFKTNKS